MDRVDFLNDFRFRVYRFRDDHFTDRSKTPSALHYFGRLISGTARIQTQSRELRLRPGDIFYIPKGLSYRSHWHCAGGEEIVFVSFGFACLPTDKTFVLQKLTCSETGRKVFAGLCRDVAVTEKSVGSLYFFFGQEAAGMEQARRTRTNPVLEKALAFLEEHPDLGNPALARHCSVSESGIYVLFRKQLGKTPNAVRQEILCKRAAVLLTTTDRSVQEISDSLGFSSTSYFRKVLKRRFGMTPREIRKRAFA